MVYSKKSKNNSINLSSLIRRVHVKYLLVLSTGYDNPNNKLLMLLYYVQHVYKVYLTHFK